jgi:hypothetical protein
MDTPSDCAHLAQRNLANSLIKLTNRDPSEQTRVSGKRRWAKEVEMKFFAVLVATCAMSQAASAQPPVCKSIVDAAPRLACYDNAAPPATAKPADAATIPAPRADPAKYVDPISAEDALMNARLKNICHGC